MIDYVSRTTTTKISLTGRGSDRTGAPLVDFRLQPAQLGGAALVLPQQVADVVAGAGIAPLGHARLGPFLEAFEEGDVELGHAGGLQI